MSTTVLEPGQIVALDGVIGLDHRGDAHELHGSFELLDLQEGMTTNVWVLLPEGFEQIAVEDDFIVAVEPEALIAQIEEGTY